MSNSGNFVEMLDLGAITIPNDCAHQTCISRFVKRNAKQGLKISKDITDSNFQNPGRILIPGEELRVLVFQQAHTGMTTSTTERMEASAKYKGLVFPGVQGLSFVFEQKHEQLPKSLWYSSLDEKGNLHFDGMRYSIPHIFPYDDGRYEIGLLHFDYDWFRHHAFFAFYEAQ